MPIDHDAVGRTSEPRIASWGSDQALIYALGVGAGVDEPAFTTETTEGVEQQALPTMALTIGVSIDTMIPIGTFDLAKLVHGEQRLTLHRPLPVSGTVRIQETIVGIYDKGKAAVVATESVAVDVETDEPMFTKYSSSFIVGEGGWGGDRGPSASDNVAPDRQPDRQISQATSRDQALLYRLSGDRNRLHTDPVFAAAGGFDRPILHGLCTYGFAARALLNGLCEGDPVRFNHIEGRFSAPVYPGDTLTTSMWHVGEGRAVFTTALDNGTVVIDRGGFGFGS